LQLINIWEKLDLSPTLQRRFQFSLRCLLEWITITAIFMGSLTYMFGQEGNFVFRNDWFETAVWALCCAICCLLLTPAVLSIHWNSAHITIQMIFAFLVLRFFCLGGISCAFSWDDGRLARLFLTLTIFFASLWYFRGVGYRLVWRKAG
jgi:hypothetical protein